MTIFNNRLLKGGSGFKKNFQEPFNKQQALSNCINWGVPENVISEMWSEGGNVSSQFGTAIHDALENKQKGLPINYDLFTEAVNYARKVLVKYGTYGEKISEYRYQAALKKEAKKKKSGIVTKDINYAYPSHPLLIELIKINDSEHKAILDNILKGFDKLAKKKKLIGEVVCEPLVTYVPYHMGGFVDRLLIIDKDKKICRVGDYKVNIKADVKDKKHKMSAEYEHLPSTKLSEFTLQTNYYAFCLWKAGWTIQGLDAFVFEGEWKHYELELFDMVEFEHIIKKYNLN